MIIRSVIGGKQKGKNPQSHRICFTLSIDMKAIFFPFGKTFCSHIWVVIISSLIYYEMMSLFHIFCMKLYNALVTRLHRIEF